MRFTQAAAPSLQWIGIRMKANAAPLSVQQTEWRKRKSLLFPHGNGPQIEA